MSTSEKKLHQIAKLACLSLNKNTEAQLQKDVKAIIQFVDQLHTLNTENIAPLIHPLDLHQRLRNDEAHAQNDQDELRRIAPEFSEGLYLVPKVIDTEK